MTVAEAEHINDNRCDSRGMRITEGTLCCELQVIDSVSVTE
jgi:hypothetical protein